MALKHAGLLLLFLCSSVQFRSGVGYGLFVQDPDLEWERMKTVIGEKTPRAPAPNSRALKSSPSTPDAKKVPEYQVISASQVQKEVFKPEKGARPLPSSVKEMLLATAAPATTAGTTRPQIIEVLCHVDRLYVRVRREVFKTKGAYKNLKLGTCPVNRGTKEHYYFLYLLKNDCGFVKENNADNLLFRNALKYSPPGPVLRELPFNIPLECTFPRFFNAFKVGFYPVSQGGTIYKALQPKSSFTLTPQDASGIEVTGTKTFTLGQPMYFEAKKPDGTAQSGLQRLYINKCFMTASQDSNANPKYTVIDNQGCMVDGKVSYQSKFLTGSSKMVQKFSVGALIFKDQASTSSSKQLYMHCDISLGELTPTQSSKACNYDSTSKKWKELYGDDSVCTCCEATCSVQPKASRNIITSHSWKVDLSSTDGSVALEPQMKSFAADTFSLEDTDMAEHEDFLSYWKDDY
ncbi:zona pellucida sperm-binding protein 3 [Larimichthys crocea]|uniref:zona pellucida sperm-binding protein 3 n=1 Tax=Larimichthys crocea TaxID=215358 RepID=UPI000901FAC1|nr:zona pellucida sperm-binding protein 3 [Larimichthys crocea]